MSPPAFSENIDKLGVMLHHRDKIRQVPRIEFNYPIVLSESDVDYLLKDLCVGRGFCLSPDKKDEFKSNPPTDIDAFSTAFFVAYGYEIPILDEKFYRTVRDVVAEAFKRAANRHSQG